MASSSFVKIACVIVIAMVVVAAAAAPAAAALTCGVVTSNLLPCVKYIKTGAGIVPGKCCSGIRNVNRLARTTQDRRDACKCLKTRAAAIRSLKLNVVAGLPGKCGVYIRYKISPSTNCNTVY